jgi:23S rRNA (uracil1939-C5)-methyltransferase
MMTSASNSATKSGESTEELARLKLDRIGQYGDCVAEFEGGEISVFGGIPGEIVDARILRFRRRRTDHIAAIVTGVVELSIHRVSPPCPYFGDCTGCQWQHIAYDHQLVLKHEQVSQHISKYGSLAGVSIEPTLASPDQFHYRNHARFTVRRQGSLGYVNRITRQFTRVDQCMLMADGINQILAKLQDRSGETSQLSVRYGINTGDFLIQPTLRNPDIPLPSGQTHYRERLLGRPFRVASPSFFQVNTAQAEQMARLVAERLDLRGDELVVDAYAGVGTFAVLIAPHAGRVIAIEESPAAVRDAAINTLGLNNVEYIEGKTEDVLISMERAPDVVILDPPRVGCDPAGLDALLRIMPRRLVYVSCDPESLARDLDILVRGGYAIDGLQPVDMFPQTYHVECVATLSHEGDGGE